MSEEVDAGQVVGQSPPIRIADGDGRIPRDGKRFYEKMKGVVGPMVTILLEELVRLDASDDIGRPGKIDFGARLPKAIASHLAEPIP